MILEIYLPFENDTNQEYRRRRCAFHTNTKMPYEYNIDCWRVPSLDLNLDVFTIATCTWPITYLCSTMKVLSLLLFHPAFKPTFVKRPLPRLSKAALRGNLTIICEPEGAPQPEITWFKNGVALPESSGHYRKLRNGFLVVSDIQVGDQGTYTCTATNINGDASSSTELSVSGECTQDWSTQEKIVLFNVCKGHVNVL